MGYRSDIRMIVTKEGYKELNNYIQDKVKEDDSYYDLMQNTDIKQKCNDIYYLGWTDLKFKDSELLRCAESMFYEKNLTFRMCILGENIEDVSVLEYTEQKDLKKDIPYIYIKREFDELDIQRQLRDYAEENEMECE